MCRGPLKLGLAVLSYSSPSPVLGALNLGATEGEAAEALTEGGRERGKHISSAWQRATQDPEGPPGGDPFFLGTCKEWLGVEDP